MEVVVMVLEEGKLRCHPQMLFPIASRRPICASRHQLPGQDRRAVVWRVGGGVVDTRLHQIEHDGCALRVLSQGRGRRGISEKNTPEVVPIKFAVVVARSLDTDPRTK
jgi:hypothetical protein